MDVVILTVGIFSFVLGSGVLSGIHCLGDLEMLGISNDRIELAPLVAVVPLSSPLSFLKYAP